MTATVTHKKKAGDKLTGAEYESTSHHVVSIAVSDIGAAADDHDHDADYAVIDHTHEGGITHPQALARGLGA